MQRCVSLLTMLLVFSPEEIYALVQSLPKRKACGPDSLSIEHFIHAPPVVFYPWATLFNSILRLHFVPPFTNSKIVSIFKCGGKDSTLPSSYRGISLSSNLS